MIDIVGGGYIDISKKAENYILTIHDRYGDIVQPELNQFNANLLIQFLNGVRCLRCGNLIDDMPTGSTIVRECDCKK